MKESTDVVIIGGGVIGCAIAYHLSKQRVKVIVLDRGELGAQASRVATGLLAPVRPFIQEDDPYTTLVLSSLALFPSLIAELAEVSGPCVELERTATLRVAHAKQIPRLQKWIARWQQAGYEMELLTGDAVAQYEPLLSSNITTAIYSPQELHINAQQLVHAYAQAAAQLGAVFYAYREVTSLQRPGTSVTGVFTSQGDSIACKHLVIAMGAWGACCGDWLGITIPVRPLRGQSLLLRQPVTPLRHILFGEGIYLVPKRDGTIIVGATKDDVGFDTSTTPEGIARLLDAVKRLLPDFDCRVESARAGLRPKTPDNHPILGAIPGWENVTLATGHTGFGILLSPITGQAIAEYIITGQTPVSIRPFTCERFQAATSSKKTR